MRNAINDSITTSRVGVFDDKRDEALRADGLSVPNDHVVRGALRPLFRDASAGVVATLEGLLTVADVKEREAIHYLHTTIITDDGGLPAHDSAPLNRAGTWLSRSGGIASTPQGDIPVPWH
jgi:hypothetical protein